MNLRILFLAGLIMTASLVRAQDANQPTAVSLQEAIDYAVENNQNLLKADLEVDIADTQVGETISEGLPQINGELSLNYNFEPQKSLLPPEALGIDLSDIPQDQLIDGELPLSFQQKYDGTASVALRQLIFDGSFFVGLQASKTFKELSTKEYVRTKIDVVEAITKAYYTVLVSQERNELIETNLTRIDSLLRETKIMNENGFAEKIDVNRLQVQFNNLTTEYESSVKLLQVSKDMLKFQMGMPISNDIELTDDLEAITFDLEEVEEFDYSDRIEYSQLQTNMALTNLDLKNNKVQYLPNLYANAAYGYNTQTGQSDQWFKTDRWLNFGFVGATLSVPIFDGLLKSNRIQRNKLQIKQLEQDFDQLENNIDLEIREARINMDNALNRMATQRENMELSEEIYNVTKIKYEEGVGSNLEVVEADADYKEAQTNYINALYEALIAKVDLEKAYGKLLDNQ